MGFKVKQRYIRAVAREKINIALSLVASATEYELNVIDSMYKFYKKNKYLSCSQLSYLEAIIDSLSRKNTNVRFRIG